MSTSENNIIDSYELCQELASSHYENFPVASFLLPRNIRKAVAAIYAFARIADDISDEGDHSPENRIAMLNELEELLNKISKGEIVEHNYLCALSHTILSFNLPIDLFFDLIKAFKQDVHKKDYNNMMEVLDYCKYSANPIGRLLLHLCNEDTNENLKLSDHLCTSFQLFNFAQDVHLDLLHRNRCYLPKELMSRFSLTNDDILNFKNTDNFQQLMKEFINTSKAIFMNGAPLARNIKGKFGLEIKATVTSVEELIIALDKRVSPYDRPTIKKAKLLKIVFKSIFFNFFHQNLDPKNAEPQSILP